MNTNDRLLIPENIDFIIKRLNEKGFEAYLVGGCVRDSILGRVPYDWDVTTSAFPQDIKKIFDKTYDTGIKHGTVSVVVNNTTAEVTTYRVDGKYSDFRRPDEVRFTSSLREDLERRDFTVNALAYHPETGITDYFEGLGDIADRRIKAVGDANTRFQEDALRMLRAIRFSAQLGFSIEKDTFQAIKNNSELIKNISIERIRDELNKILTSPNPMYFNLLYETGLLAYIIPEFLICYETAQNNPYHIYNVAEHILHTVESIKESSILRWTMLLHDIGKPARRTTDDRGIDHFYGHQAVSADIARTILTRLRFDNDSVKKIINLIVYHDIDIFDNEKSIRKVINKVGDGAFLDLLEVQRADARAQNRVYLQERVIKLDNIKKMYFNIKSKNQCIDKRALAVNGDDLLSIGIQPDRSMKQMLDYLFELVLENPELNEKQKLIELAKKRENN